MIVAEDKKIDAIVARICESTIVLDMINYLTNLRDNNVKQTICLTPYNEERNLLLKKPIHEIKDGKFFIINKQKTRVQKVVRDIHMSCKKSKVANLVCVHCIHSPQ